MSRIRWFLWLVFKSYSYAEKYDFLGHCPPPHTLLSMSCTAQSTFWFPPRAVQNPPDQDFRAAAGSCNAQTPNLHTLTFSLSAQYRPTFVNSKTTLFSENLTIFNKNQHFCEPILATSLKRLLNLHKPVTCPINYAKSRLFGKM